ncbi:hypothetical protein DPMN_003331 [Dreissena polymorpha]|uniref:Uncharacterized protein n=1 Tax=Dreissena polymorpha TaxID=45954 RepID=A0A9D4RTR1_DREPO|nr:hypothetical protein DPMN_002185 [Dreissena polymorpha]KAH3879428.1 hypothetical protein DPMN_003331 [Dreissena polymorpha]
MWPLEFLRANVNGQTDIRLKKTGHKSSPEKSGPDFDGIKKIIHETLKDHYNPISIYEIPFSNLSFADDIDLIGGISSELQDLTNRLFARAYKL